jgi:hypothetical protein
MVAEASATRQRVRRTSSGRPETYLTVAEVCAELQINERTFREWWAKSRARRCIMLPNGQLRIVGTSWSDGCPSTRTSPDADVLQRAVLEDRGLQGPQAVELLRPLGGVGARRVVPVRAGDRGPEGRGVRYRVRVAGDDVARWPGTVVVRARVRVGRPQVAKGGGDDPADPRVRAHPVDRGAVDRPRPGPSRGESSAKFAWCPVRRS